jgi:hypothetical protein
MTKKRTVNPRFKKLIREAVQTHLHVIGQTDFSYTILYPAEDRHPSDSTDGIGTTWADVHISLRYLTVDICAYPSLERRWKEKGITDEEVKEIIAHELAHLITEHMKNLIYATFKDEGEVKDAWEAATTRVGRMLYKLGQKV